jgi:hypothetical protein
MNNKNTFRYRLSNVIAWIGFLGAAVMLFAVVLILINLMGNGGIGNWDEPFLASLPVYLGCALFNYLMVGSFRLLPWGKLD